MRGFIPNVEACHGCEGTQRAVCACGDHDGIPLCAACSEASHADAIVDVLSLQDRSILRNLHAVAHPRPATSYAREVLSTLSNFGLVSVDGPIGMRCVSLTEFGALALEAMNARSDSAPFDATFERAPIL